MKINNAANVHPSLSEYRRRLPVVAENISRYQLATANNKSCEHIARFLSVEHFYEYFMARSFIDKQRTSFAYHGRDHNISVALNALEGACLEGLDEFHQKGLFVAGLFHDLGHSLGKRSDHANITVAIGLFDKAFNLQSPKEQENNRALRSFVKKCIRTTEFPYRQKNVTPIELRIMRDADMMSFYDTPTQQLKLFKGLYYEKNSAWLTTKAQCADFAVSNEEFLRGIKWRTQWALDKMQVRNFEECLKVTRSIIEDAHTFVPYTGDNQD